MSKELTSLILKALGKKENYQRLSSAESFFGLRLVQSSGMKTAQRLYKKSQLHIPILRF